MQSDYGVCYSRLYSVEPSGQRKPWSDLADVQATLDRCCPYKSQRHSSTWRGLKYVFFNGAVVFRSPCRQYISIKNTHAFSHACMHTYNLHSSYGRNALTFFFFFFFFFFVACPGAFRQSRKYNWCATFENDPYVTKPQRSLRIPTHSPGLSITKTSLFKYTENFTTKKWKLTDKKIWYFSHFCSKHRLWVLVRTALMRRF